MSNYGIFPTSNFYAIWTKERGNFFYLVPIFMKIGPAGPNFTAKIGPRVGSFYHDPGPNFSVKFGPGGPIFMGVQIKTDTRFKSQLGHHFSMILLSLSDSWQYPCTVQNVQEMATPSEMCWAKEELESPVRKKQSAATCGWYVLSADAGCLRNIG